MRYLITGAAGFIGSNLARRLTADGHEVVALDDMSRGRRERLSHPGISIHEGDVRDSRAVADAMQGCGTVIHLAFCQGTQTFYSEPRQVLDVAVRGMSAVLAACEATGCADLMLVSSSEAYQVPPDGMVPTPETVPLSVPDPLNPRYSYGGGKIVSELMALAWQRTGVLDRAVILRPHNIVGADMGREHVLPEFCIRMNRLVREHPEGVIPFAIQGTGLETRSFCHVDDCVDQMCLLLGKVPDGQHIYNLGVMDERTIADAAHEVASCYGREIKVIPGSLPKGSPPRRLPDISRLRGLVPGYLPSVGFAEAVRRTVDWYKING